MFWLKNCPRCSGDVYQETDTYGPYISCVQCGFNKDLPEQFRGLAPFGLMEVFGSLDVASLAKEEVGVGS